MNLKGAAPLLFVSALIIALAMAPEASSQPTPDVTCRLNGAPADPTQGEFTLFTFQNSSGGTYNAHGARSFNPGAFANRVICKNFTTASFAQAACPSSQSPILSFSNYTNAHVEQAGGSYAWNACGRAEDEDGDNALSCVVRSTACLPFEGALVSLQNSAGGSTNAHVAEPGVYANNLCCSLRCFGASCITVRTPAPETFSETGEAAEFDVELFNRDGENAHSVVAYLSNTADYAPGGMHGSYGGAWTYTFVNTDLTESQTPTVSVGPKATATIRFRVTAPPRAPPSTDFAPYRFVIRVRDV